MFRSSSTYIYLAVALGLFCYVVFVDKKIPGTKQREAAEAQLFQINPDDINGLEITNSHNVFIFLKVNGHWEIKKPVNTLADNGTVDGIINLINAAEPTRRPIDVDGSDKDTGDLKKWGLIPPAERVVIHTKDKQYELLVGRKTAINDNVYARASDKKNEPVRVIPGMVKDSLQKDLSDFRSRSVFDFDVDKVVQVATRIADAPGTPGQQSEIDLKDGKWTMQMPLVARASDADVTALLAKVLGERVVDFVIDGATNVSTYGLTTPAATISVTLQSDKGSTQEPMVLEIGGPVPNKPDQVYAQRLKSNSVFTLNRASVDELLKGLANVRDRHVMPFDPNKPTGISYTFGAKKGQLRADKALWYTVGTAEGPADSGKATDILAKLSQLQTTPVLKDSATDLKPFGLDKPQGEITIQSAEFKPGPSMTLKIGKAENKLLYVRNSAEPFIYTVPDNTFDFLPANNLVLRDGRAINLKNEQVKSMTIAKGTSSVTLLRSTGGTWSVPSIKDRMVDSTKAETQAALFSQLKGNGWIGPALPSYALNKPVLTISVLADQPIPTTLRIGATLPNGDRAAQVEGDPTVFALSGGDFGILNVSTLKDIPKELGAPPATNTPATNAPTTNTAPTPQR